MLKDSLGNEIKQGVSLCVELDTPITVVKGELAIFEEGHVSTLAAPGKTGQITPTRLVIMVPIEIGLDPRADVAMRLSVLQVPAKAEAPPAAKGKTVTNGK